MIRYFILCITFIFCIIVPFKTFADINTFTKPENNFACGKSVASTDVYSDANSVQLEYDLTNVSQQTVELDGETFTSSTITNEGATYDYGKPVLPSISRFIIVPPDVGLELNVTVGRTKQVQTGHPPALCMDEELSIEYPKLQHHNITTLSLSAGCR
ncbi:MAG: hypothetical protein P9X24_03945 [Candidatus Hatepunaea meridiana]|nr:hypothetical protein [Candidatus Hatepunaea meridiana]